MRWDGMGWDELRWSGVGWVVHSKVVRVANLCRSITAIAQQGGARWVWDYQMGWDGVGLGWGWVG